MKYDKEILVKDYFTIHNFYSKIYGEKTLILIQIGVFYECYGTNEDGANLKEIAKKLDILCIKKNIRNPLSKLNPRIISFPIYIVQDYIEKLLNMNYTIIKINQTTHKYPVKREIADIIIPKNDCCFSCTCS